MSVLVPDLLRLSASTVKKKKKKKSKCCVDGNAKNASCKHSETRPVPSDDVSLCVNTKDPGDAL